MSALLIDNAKYEYTVPLTMLCVSALLTDNIKCEYTVSLDNVMCE